MTKKRATTRPAPDDMIHVKLRLPREIHRRVKVAAATAENTMGQVIAESLDKVLPKVPK